MPEPSDAELLRRIADGDQPALGALYDRYAGFALGLAMKVVRDRGAAEEVVQDAFVSVWRRAGSYQPERGEPRTWLLSIVHHRAIDKVRGAANRARMEQVDLGLAADRSGTADVWGEAWSKLERAEILSAMESLPPEQREAIELGFFRGLSHVEVAEETGEPLGTIKGRMRLGLRRLRTVLEGRGMEPAG